MKFLCVFVALFVVAMAESYPEWYAQQRMRRDVRDLKYEHDFGKDGRIFGTLGQNSNGLFGRGGYENNIFNDHRGQLTGQVHGTRVLGPLGDSSHLGGTLNWKNPNAAASLDVSRQIHGPSSINAAAGARWPIGKSGDITASGFYDKTSGMRHDYGARADLNLRF